MHEPIFLARIIEQYFNYFRKRAIFVKSGLEVNSINFRCDYWPLKERYIKIKKFRVSEMYSGVLIPIFNFESSSDE